MTYFFPELLSAHFRVLLLVVVLIQKGLLAEDFPLLPKASQSVDASSTTREKKKTNSTQCLDCDSTGLLTESESPLLRRWWLTDNASFLPDDVSSSDSSSESVIENVGDVCSGSSCCGDKEWAEGAG